MSILGAAAIGAGASILGNLFGSSSNNKTNQTNLKIAQMNNEWSEKLMQKQMDYNTQMWNAQNEYNDPSKQVERLKRAGLNPALMLGNMSPGIAQSGNSVGLPSPSSASVQPYHYDFSGIGDAVMQGMQLQNQTDVAAAQINNLNAQADVARARAAADNAWTYERLKETRVGRLFLEQTFDVRKNQMNADFQNTLRTGRQIEEGTRLIRSNYLLKMKELSIFDANAAAGLANCIADTLLKQEQRIYTKQQAIHEIQKMYKTSAEAQGIRISNDVAKQSADSIVKQAEEQARLLEGQADTTYFNSGSQVFSNALNTLLMFGLFKGFGPKLSPIKGFGR